jgi:hypothetical protein
VLPALPPTPREESRPLANIRQRLDRAFDRRAIDARSHLAHLVQVLSGEIDPRASIDPGSRS